jgi:hypothetical protein
MKKKTISRAAAHKSVMHIDYFGSLYLVVFYVACGLGIMSHIVIEFVVSLRLNAVEEKVDEEETFTV